ncbi:hypothetical protein K502DRAFT_154044 [Neoconidiobolus thromboides FSU 785]|nr:hypothetical protein K502DRAFT_154044 [Neoconidiobolus thromboides FSU 785]
MWFYFSFFFLKIKMSLNIEIPIISFENYLNKENESEYKKECEKAAQSLINYGVLLVKDPRVREEYNQEFLDCVENYFEQDYDTKLKDSRPEYHYQVGVTPGNVEDPKCKSDLKCQELIKDVSITCNIYSTYVFIKIKVI